MDQWVMLLRGVNVGGKNRLPMKELIFHLELGGFKEVKSYIQSGNLVFKISKGNGSSLSKKAQNIIQKAFGFTPEIMMLSKKEFLKAIKSNPFIDEAEENTGKNLHVFFLSEKPKSIDHQQIDALKLPSESWDIFGAIFYLYCPKGFHLSKIALKIEKILGVSATVRNWRTVTQIRDL